MIWLSVKNVIRYLTQTLGLISQVSMRGTESTEENTYSCALLDGRHSHSTKLDGESSHFITNAILYFNTVHDRRGERKHAYCSVPSHLFPGQMIGKLSSSSIDGYKR